MNRDTLERRIEEILESLGFELVALERGGGRRRPLLRIRVDRRDGEPGRSTLTVDDCAAVSRAVEARLDETGEAGESYILEVSSPGVERPLVRRRDYERFVGLEVRLRGYRPLVGDERQIEGVLKGVMDMGEARPQVVLDVDGAEVYVPMQDIAKANLTYSPEEDL